MPTRSDLPTPLRDATEEFLAADATSLADELTEALVRASLRVAGLKRRVGPQHALSEDVGCLDGCFGQAVALARDLASALRRQRDSGAYTSVSQLARELGRQLVASMPENASVTVRCAPEPAIAAVPASELRRILATLVRQIVVGTNAAAGELSLEVGPERDPGTGRPAAIVVTLAHRALRPAAAADAADQVRALVNAGGGSVEPCAQPGGGSAVVVTLQAAR